MGFKLIEVTFDVFRHTLVESLDSKPVNALASVIGHSFHLCHNFLAEQREIVFLHAPDAYRVVFGIIISNRVYTFSCFCERILKLLHVISLLKICKTMTFFLFVEIFFVPIVAELLDHQCFIRPPRRHQLGDDWHLSNAANYLIQLAETKHRAAKSHLRYHQERYHNVDGNRRIERRRYIETHHIGKYKHRE